MSTLFGQAMNGPCVKLYPFVGGHITLPEKFLVAPADENARHNVPSMAFLIEHPDPPDCPLVRLAYGYDGVGAGAAGEAQKTPFRLFFDLGLRSSVDRYITALQPHFENRKPYDLSPGVAKVLRGGHVMPEDIDAVILSHVHYDHHGDPEDFPRTAFLIGHSTKSLLKDGLGATASFQHFDAMLLPEDRTFELPDPLSNKSTKMSEANGSLFQGQEWRALGPFPAAFDLFGDGSIYIIDAPGHLPGHINALVRAGPEKWFYLAGDACHDFRLLTGEKDIGTWKDDTGQTQSSHVEIDAAKQTIERIRQLAAIEPQRVEVVLAHDPAWAETNKHRFYPNHI